MAEKSKSVPTKMILDFTNVKDRGPFNPKHKPEGDYRAKIIGINATTSSNGNSMWEYAVQLTSDERAVYPERCILTESSLWKLRNLFTACGLKVPKKRVNVDGSKVVGKEIGITLEDDEYEGKMKSVIAATFPVGELSGDEPEDEGDDDEEEVADEEEEVEDELEVDEL